MNTMSIWITRLSQRACVMGACLIWDVLARVWLSLRHSGVRGGWVPGSRSRRARDREEGRPRVRSAPQVNAAGNRRGPQREAVRAPRPRRCALVRVRPNMFTTTKKAIGYRPTGTGHNVRIYDGLLRFGFVGGSC